MKPAQRLGLVMLIVGCVAFLVAALALGDAGDALDRVGPFAFRHKWPHALAAFGFWTAIAGLALRFLSRPFGRLLTWIVRGS